MKSSVLRSFKNFRVFFFAFVCLGLYGIAANAEVALTVYNNDLGLVREVRQMDIQEGIHEVTLTDVAAQIDATSVRIKSLSDPATRVLEQNFRYDGLMLERMLVGFLNKPIHIVDRAGQEHEGMLIAIGQTTEPTINRPQSAGSNDLILIEDEKIVLVEGGPKQVLKPAVDESLVLIPTLAWQIAAKKSGKQDLELSYLTGGISWTADYTLVMTDKSDLADLSGWVTLNNRSGADYRDAKLKLVAGDVNRVVEAPVPMRRGREKMALYAMDEAAGQAFEERGFFEYHLYELQRSTDVLDNEQKQVELLTANGIKTERVYIYDYRRDAEKVAVELRFKNEEENNLGIPLPKGRIRMFSRDEDETMQFVGEAQIDHTPKKEKIELEVGKVFDMKAERKVMDAQDDKSFSSRTHTETIEVKLRNRKDEDVTIRVREYPGARHVGDWEIKKNSHEFEKKDAYTVEFPVPVPADSEVTLTYTFEQVWPD